MHLVVFPKTELVDAWVSYFHRRQCPHYFFLSHPKSFDLWAGAAGNPQRLVSIETNAHGCSHISVANFL